LSAIRSTSSLVGHLLVEVIKKTDELVMAVTRFALEDDRTIE